MAKHSIGIFGSESNPWQLSDEDIARQAIASLRGYVYQLHTSVADWIRLPENAELYLEVAEDYAKVLGIPGTVDDELHTIQVKDTRESGSVTLNCADVLKAISSLFSLQESNPGRSVYMTFLTTAPIGKEITNRFPSNRAGLTQWNTATSQEDISEILQSLQLRFQDESSLATFLKHCSAEMFKERLLSRLTFACNSAQAEQIEFESREYLADIRAEVQAEATSASKAYDVILGALIKKAINPNNRSLTRQQFLTKFAEATAYSIPSQVFINLTAQASSASAAQDAGAAQVRNSLVVLNHLSQRLIDFARPPSLLPLFPDASNEVQVALEKLSEVPRWVLDERTKNQKEATRIMLSTLAGHEQIHHLIYAPPGAGKSHALHGLASNLLQSWRIANAAELEYDIVLPDKTSLSLLHSLLSPSLLPILLSIGGFKTAESVLAAIQGQYADVDLQLLFKDKNICVLLDGWSEFAVNDVAERSTLLLALQNVRIIATARQQDDSDANFKCWALESLSPTQAYDAHKGAFGTSEVPDEKVVDLLRLPLLLSLYLLLGGTRSTPGELIAAFQRRISKKLPNSFEDVLADAVSNLSFRSERSLGSLHAALRVSATHYGLAEPLEALNRLGTISQRGSVAVPIHDLYWSWLAGIGILRGHKLRQALSTLGTRESINLALESGEHVEATWVNDIAGIDAVLAASLDACLNATSINSKLAAQLNTMFAHPNLAVRCRAAIAGFRTGRAFFVKRALEVVDQAVEEIRYVPSLMQSLNPERLFVHRAELSSWLGGPGTSHVLNEIASRGSAQWVPWLEAMLRNRQISEQDAVFTALACAHDIPEWTLPLLPELIAAHAHNLHNANARGANKPLALWMAQNYIKIESTDFSPGWHCNRLLISCGDDEVYEALLSHFPAMSKGSQENLSYAIPEFGDKWVARFQTTAFSILGQSHMRRLREIVSLEINDTTAREWIEHGYHSLGWKILIARNGLDVLPELVAELPPIFAGHPQILALEALASFKELPESILGELDKRMFYVNTGGAILSPMVIDYALEVASLVHPNGMGWLVRKCIDIPALFTGYYGARFAELYADWIKSTGMAVVVGTPENPVPFDEWFIQTYLLESKEESVLPRVFRNFPLLAVKFATQKYSSNDEKCKLLLSNLVPLTSYTPQLLERMIESEALAPLILQIFSEVFNHFPSKHLLRVVESPLIDDAKKFFALRNANSTAFRESHRCLIERLISSPIALDRIRNVASMLVHYEREDLFELFQSMLADNDSSKNDQLQWLLREVGNVTGMLIIDEHGKLLRE